MKMCYGLLLAFYFVEFWGWILFVFKFEKKVRDGETVTLRGKDKGIQINLVKKKLHIPGESDESF